MALPDSRVKLFDEQFAAKDKITGQPLIGLPYRIDIPGQPSIRGVTDSEGKTVRVATADAASIKVLWGEWHQEDSALFAQTSNDC